MGVNKVDLANGETLIDLQNDTVTPETLAKDVTAHNAQGEQIIGTMVIGSNEPTLIRSGQWGDNVTWSVYDDGRFVVSGSGAMDDVPLSATSSAYYATEKGECEWSPYREGVTTIIIEEGITVIGKAFFYGFPDTKKVIIAEGVTEINTSAFGACTNLSIVELPATLNRMASRVFTKCTALKSITIPKSVTKLASSVFQYCSQLETIFYAGTKAEWDLLGRSLTDLGAINATLCCAYEEVNIKEEQEQTIDIERNGTMTVLPDEGKTLSKVTVNVNVPTEGGGGSGIIDVTELPTSGIDENAVYRVTETIQLEKTEVYLQTRPYPADAITLLKYLKSLGVSTVPTIYVVDELSNMLETDVQTFSVVNVYILRSDGVAYLNVPAYGGIITVGLFGFQSTDYDKGFTKNIDEERALGVYTTIEAFKEITRYFIRESGEWKEVTAHFEYDMPHGFTNVETVSGDITPIAYTAADILGKRFTEIDESWFLKSNGEYEKKIRQYSFAYCLYLQTAVIPEFIEEVESRAFVNNDKLKTVTFKGKPRYIDQYTFQGCDNLTTINVPWAEGEVEGAPWSATNATINYNYTEGKR